MDQSTDTNAAIWESEEGVQYWAADRLGHADAAITLRVYAHVLPDDAARAADVFAQALGVRVESV